jgi:hypothetical protein
MPNLLPTLFIVFGACALIVTLFWLWLSLRHTLAHVEEAQVVTPDAGSEARAALLAEKQSLLLVLKDLEAERDNGKLSEADFNDLNVRYRSRARSVLKALDSQLAPHRDAAKSLLQSAREGIDVAPAETAAVVRETEEKPDASGSIASNACASCSTANDPDAAFCKKCGARLWASTGAES